MTEDTDYIGRFSEDEHVSWLSKGTNYAGLSIFLPKHKTLRVCIAAVTAFPENIAYVPDEHKAICEMIIKLRGGA